MCFFSCAASLYVRTYSNSITSKSHSYNAAQKCYVHAATRSHTVALEVGGLWNVKLEHQKLLRSEITKPMTDTQGQSEAELSGIAKVLNG